MTGRALTGPDAAANEQTHGFAEASGPLNAQSREERLRILDEYAEHAIEAELRDASGGRWDDLGREY